jgi:hypothetical protein
MRASFFPHDRRHFPRKARKKTPSFPKQIHESPQKDEIFLIIQALPRKAIVGNKAVVRHGDAALS